MNDMLIPTQATYAELRKVNVSEFVEKKGTLSYLSWAWAVDQLLQRDPTASWDYRWHESRPYISIGETAMVFCTVKAFGVERTAQLPVMDYKNRPIPNPNSFEVNTAMQRALAKAISLHGLGLYIYAGEDLPPGEDAPERSQDGQKPVNSPITGAQICKDMHDALPQDGKDWVNTIAADVIVMLSRNDVEGAYLHIEAQKFVPELKGALWSLLDSKQRSAIKKYSETLKKAA